MKIIEKIERIIGWKYFYLISYSAVSIVILNWLLLAGYILTLDMIFAPRIQYMGTFFGLQDRTYAVKYLPVRGYHYTSK
jgi:hypothetical protein